MIVSQPERLSGNDYTIRSDVWSTGISLLELVTNRFPFPNDLVAIELMMYILQNEVCGSAICLCYCLLSFFFSRVSIILPRQPPELEDEEDIMYSPQMKDFIKKT